MFQVFRILVFLAFDFVFIDSAKLLWEENAVGGYFFFCLAAIAMFTWGIFDAIKELLKKSK